MVKILIPEILILSTRWDGEIDIWKTRMRACTGNGEIRMVFAGGIWNWNELARGNGRCPLQLLYRKGWGGCMGRIQ